ncbi:flagellar biosynthetic protein FliR [Sphingomonas hankookensis]|uniref:flagellar biosynthetic protein FliR n=1 Tax=Sphingomonas hankookensis TaxID=563996 RepID=UPI001F5818E4
MNGFIDMVVASLLLSLRIVPLLAFAQPFTLFRVPAILRVILGIGLAAWQVAANPAATSDSGFWAQGLPLVAARELFLGLTLALAPQLAFAMLLWAGRAIDVQAGFGIATLVDPATRSQMPLVGTLFVYLAGAIFFATDGPQDLLAIWAASVAQVPLGAGGGRSPVAMLDYLSGVALMAVGLAGLVLLVLFLLDLAVALLSRTLPQMNVLVLGFQVKAIATVAVLPLALSLSGALILHILRRTFDTMADIG